jgi:hypothetical protein
VVVVLDQAGSVSTLEEMTHPVVAPVERLSVAAVELSHSASEVGPARQQHEVVVIDEKAVGQA